MTKKHTWNSNRNVKSVLVKYYVTYFVKSVLHQWSFMLMTFVFGIDVICQTIVTVHSTKVRLEQLCEEIYERHVT